VLLPSLSTNVLENLLWKGGPSSDGAFASVVENRTGIITVDKTGTVFGNGAYDGRFNIDLVHDTNGILRPFALSLFHPAPREVLMIGLSSGSWAQVIASNPEVERLTVIELNPGYLRLISGRPEVASVLTNSKVSIIADDGRRWLRLHPDRRFDAIVSNTTWNFRANTTNLLSFEFLELVKNHLERGGVFFYNTTDSARVQRTGCLSFPFGARFTNHMVVSTEPVAWDFERWSTVLTAYRIDGHPVPDVREADRLMRLSAELAGTGQPGQDRFIESCPEILARTAGKIPVTDDNMGTEWRYVLGLE
jgi:hypothetical protein